MSSIDEPQADSAAATPPDSARPATLEAAPEERVLAGRYKFDAEVARGGVGTVWRATDLVLDREVAVKELRLPTDLSEAERESLLRRTTREARVAAKLAHPSVVTVLDVVNEDDRPWIVMEFLVARTLQEIIEVAGPLPYPRVAEIGMQLIGALKAAHDEGIIHRDVKPENVMISEEGRVVLTDFGLAAWTGESALTSSGRIVGSPSYIPPERAKAGPVGPASDLWSLGATLYAAVEGHPPYNRKGYIAILRGDELDEPAPAEHAGALAPVLAGLLHVKPEDRLTGDNAEKMLRIAALAPWAPETSPESAAKSAAESAPPAPLVPAPGAGDDDPPAAPEGAADDGSDTAEESGGDSGDEPDQSGDDRLDHTAREHFRAGASVLRHNVKESVSELHDSVSSLQERMREHRPESVNHLLTSIRESTDTIGLTSSGRHGGRKKPSPMVIGVVVAVVALLALILWALLFRIGG
ncbi:serine/threonine protein kinase [Murinocardiopsis flavida]|uniref:non-specific serine/threonine protein kinase n=1 Tax=Murinocardiopsis flavida TaxID=645275 RepID=A0A2P8D4X3_9ACTN|nr:serine/threonine-protein kinase [Murinocardiopsis flavida]PSK92252.1 serine/threonine protein kinase [Murinocardiopsis flavida]